MVLAKGSPPMKAQRDEQNRQQAGNQYQRLKTQRPGYASDQVEQVWESAKSPDGLIYDPWDNEQLLWDRSKPRTGQWDMGHKPAPKPAFVSILIFYLAKIVYRCLASMDGTASPRSYLPIITLDTPLLSARSVCDHPFYL